MNGLARGQRPRYDRLAFRAQGDLVQSVRELGGHAIARGRVESSVSRPPDIRAVPLAEAVCRLDDRIEHRLQIKFRPTDDLEHLRSGGLLLEGRGKLERTCLCLYEQACVLDCDQRLVGECAYELNLLI